METVTQKKFSINVNQKEFLADYKKSALFHPKS